MLAKHIMMASMATFVFQSMWVQAGEIESIFCRDGRFTVNTVPDAGETCSLEMETIRGGVAEILPARQINTRTSTFLSPLTPNESASVSATLTCKGVDETTQSISDRFSDTVNGCSTSNYSSTSNSSATPTENPASASVSCEQGEFRVSVDPNGNQNCRLHLQLNTNDQWFTPVLSIHDDGVSEHTFPLSSDGEGSLSAILTCRNIQTGSVISTSVSGEANTGCLAE